MRGFPFLLPPNAILVDLVRPRHAVLVADSVGEFFFFEADIYFYNGIIKISPPKSGDSGFSDGPGAVHSGP